MSLTRDAILGAQDSRVEKVDVPEWGGTVCVRMMTGTERDAYEHAMYVKAKTGTFSVNARAYLLSKTICDEDGATIFTEADIDAIGSKGAIPLERLVKVARKLNKLEDEAIETAVKN